MAILTRMYQRRGTQAQWNAVANTVILQSGEIGLEHDTGRFKLGDGSSVWSNLPYYLPDNNPAASGIRQGKNAHDIYSKLSPLAPSYTQTFTGAQVLVPQNNAQTPLVVSGLSGQSAVLQRWRDSLDTTLASIDANGKLLAKGGAQFDANVNVNANKIINLAAPTNPQDATNKQYVDDAIAGLIWKSPINLVSASGLDTFINVPLTGNTNTLILDGHAALDSTDTGYRILLVAQTTATENGIYVYNDNGTTYTLTRAVDADTYQELNSASVFVNEGTHYGTSSWVQTNHYLTSFADQDWVQFNGASQIVADGGLTKSGNTLAVGGTTDRIKINPNSVDISENYVGQTSITTLGTIGTGTWNATTIAANKGGTGQSSYAIGDILYASSTSALSKLSPGTSGYPLISGGTGNGPSYARVNTTGIANDAVTYDKLQNISAQHRILGRASAGAGNAEELTPDQLMTTINQGNTDISFNLLPVGTTSTTVSQGDHTHTLDDLSDVIISGTPAARQVIKYDGTKWINELPSGGISIGASAPTGASAGDAWFDSTDGSLYVYYDDANPGKVNLVTNPSFEVNTTGWTASAGVTITRSTSEYFNGSASMSIACPSVGDFVRVNPYLAVSASQIYTFSVYVKAEAGKLFRLQLAEYTSADVQVGSLTLGSDITGTGSWQRVDLSRTFGSTGVKAGLVFQNRTSGAHTFYVDAVQLEVGSTASTYFDGDSPNSFWNGTPHNSTSNTVGGTGGSQWVQVKANSALEASILTRLSAVEARDTKLEAANAVRVSSQSERTSVYPSPVQGNTVFRADLGYEEKYYAAYNATTNPDGVNGTPGWYEYRGGAPLSENYLINADFGINQRNFSSSTATDYGFDRWRFLNTGGTGTYSAQTFTLGTSPLSSYDAKNFARVVPSGQSLSTAATFLQQRIESVRTLAGQTITVSFWAKVASGTPKVSVEFQQSFGTGGSPSSTVSIYAGQVTLSTSWARYSVTVSVPSLSGKTIGTSNDDFISLNLWVSAGSDFNSRTNSLGIQSNTFDFWGVQVEQGPVPTDFRRNQPNIQAELAACQRYFIRYGGDTLYNTPAIGYMENATQAKINFFFPVTMRTAPIPTIPIIGAWFVQPGNVALSAYTIDANINNNRVGVLTATTAATTSGAVAVLRANNSLGAIVDWSAEL